MSDRDRLQRKGWWIRSGMLLGVSLVLLGFALLAGTDQKFLASTLYMVGMAVIFFSMILGHRGMLRCEGNLGPVIFSIGLFAPLIYFCPFCGNNLAAEPKPIPQREADQVA